MQEAEDGPRRDGGNHEVHVRRRVRRVRLARVDDDGALGRVDDLDAQPPELRDEQRVDAARRRAHEAPQRRVVEHAALVVEPAVHVDEERVGDGVALRGDVVDPRRQRRPQHAEGVGALAVRRVPAAAVVEVARVVVGGRGGRRGDGRRGDLGRVGRLELLRGLALGLRAEVLDLGLAEDDVRVAVRRLEDVRVRDGEEDVLGLLDRDADDVGHALHAELLHGLAVLLLRAVLLALGALAGLAALGGGAVLLLLEAGHLVLIVVRVLVELGVFRDLLVEGGHRANSRRAPAESLWS
mmetsp:Transcript_9063/g.31078  ORF Transcript_9063/g.31078 Transcript_9063/m.31078 type:complete len:296 (+) Transcript_9063:1139-2026(+)